MHMPSTARMPRRLRNNKEISSQGDLWMQLARSTITTQEIRNLASLESCPCQVHRASSWRQKTFKNCLALKTTSICLRTYSIKLAQEPWTATSSLTQMVPILDQQTKVRRRAPTMGAKVVDHLAQWSLSLILANRQLYNNLKLHQQKSLQAINRSTCKWNKLCSISMIWNRRLWNRRRATVSAHQWHQRPLRAVEAWGWQPARKVGDATLSTLCRSKKWWVRQASARGNPYWLPLHSRHFSERLTKDLGWAIWKASTLNNSKNGF